MPDESGPEAGFGAFEVPTRGSREPKTPRWWLRAVAYLSVWGALVAFVLAAWNHWNNPLGFVEIDTLDRLVGAVATGLQVAAFWLIAAAVGFGALVVTAPPDESE